MSDRQSASGLSSVQGEENDDFYDCEELETNVVVPEVSLSQELVQTSDPGDDTIQQGADTSQLLQKTTEDVHKVDESFDQCGIFLI